MVKKPFSPCSLTDYLAKLPGECELLFGGH